jgi:predicted Fe-Mo cluster-binding NifX family protein
VEEYLETRPQFRKADSHAEIAKGCFSLLCTPGSWGDYEEVRIKEGGYRDRHLLSYSVVFWPWHFSHCEDVNGCQTLTDLWNSFVSESNYQRWLNYHGKWVEIRYAYDTFWERVEVWQQEADNLLLLVCMFGLSRIFTSVFESTRHDLKADLGRILVTMSQFGDLDITRLLIDKGADVSATDEDGQTPLHRASEYGYKRVAQLLIDKGADVSVTDKDRRTPLHLASDEGVAQLLIDKGVDISVSDKDGQTPLHLASDEGVAQLLIEKGADVSVTDQCGRTPLHVASSTRHEGVAQLLIEKGADLSATDKDGQTPLHLASDEGVAQLLIHRCADVSVTDKAGRTRPLLASFGQQRSVEVGGEAEKSDGQA